MAFKALPPIDYLHKLLICDATEGKLIWRPRTAETHPDNRGRETFNSKTAGKEALCYVAHNRKMGRINGNSFFAHRIIWGMHHGISVFGEIDHIDQNPLNNRIRNLREVTHSQNGRNCKRRADNTSGFTGVHFCEHKKKWVAQMAFTVGGVRQTVLHQRFGTKREAIKARKQAEYMWKFHPNHGKSSISQS